MTVISLTRLIRGAKLKARAGDAGRGFAVVADGQPAETMSASAIENIQQGTRRNMEHGPRLYLAGPARTL